MTRQVHISDHGSIVLFTALTPQAYTWLIKHTDGTWLGAALGCEWRYAADLAEGLREAGFLP